MADTTSNSSANYVLLTRLADEFAARYRAGERPSLQEYIDRHPALAEDIRAVAHPVLRHRLITNYSAEAEGITSDKIVDRLLETVRPEGGDGGKLPEVLGS